MAWWTAEGAGSSCPTPQALGMPPLSSPRTPGLFIRRGEPKSLCGPANSAQRLRGGNPSRRGGRATSHASSGSCRPVASQSPWHLTCGPLGAPRAWDVGQERKADCQEHPGVGGIHAPWALHTLNSSASRPSSPVTPASSFLLSPHLISRSEQGGRERGEGGENRAT